MFLNLDFLLHMFICLFLALLLRLIECLIDYFFYCFGSWSRKVLLLSVEANDSNTTPTKSVKVWKFESVTVW